MLLLVILTTWSLPYLLFTLHVRPAAQEMPIWQMYFQRHFCFASLFALFCKIKVDGIIFWICNAASNACVAKNTSSFLPKLMCGLSRPYFFCDPIVLESRAMYVFMYVCMLPFMECPWIGRPTGPGGGAHQKMGPMSQPHGYHRSRVTHISTYLHTECAFCSQLYSGQLRVTCFLIYLGGAESHRAR